MRKLAARERLLLLDGWADGSLGDERPARFRSAEELAEKGEIDAVVIASPNNTHREVLAPLFERVFN